MNIEFGGYFSVYYAGGGKMLVQNFSMNTDECNLLEQTITASMASVATFYCPPDNTIKDKTLYLRPFDGYAQPNQHAGNLSFPNVTCSVKPYITQADVTYRSSNNLFNVSGVVPILDSTYAVPNETVDGVKQLMSLAVTYWGNSFMDSLFALRMTSDTTSFIQALEIMIRGMIEFEGTHLRVYYAVNDAPGTVPVAGSYSVWRLGYNGQPVGLLGISPPLLFFLILAVTYLAMGMSAGQRYVSNFEPTSSTCLIAASAAGGQSGRLFVPKKGDLQADDQDVLKVNVRFTGIDGLVSVNGSNSGVPWSPLK
ncbi:hypothetical protein BDV96DRAFT_655093 [Lophiotrema nucula]|uniref:Uncharacterized protein n=1 Tax=Lophiotrema nucula TaxID=690887 RepID=A0A6A5YFR4_9PLEO|nr:hypothetical protein BDV96DRAFT_655093 [Lophiotrema nucula]